MPVSLASLGLQPATSSAATAKPDRALGWPQGSVRAIMAMVNTVAFTVGVSVAMAVGGMDAAVTMAAILGPTTGMSVGHYFGSHKPQGS